MKNRLGFTVVEIIIALVIIAVGFLPIYNLFRQGSSVTMNTVHETQATNYASDLINFCKDLNLVQIYNADSKDNIELDNDDKIRDFFSTKLSKTPPSPVEPPFVRSLIFKKKFKYTDGRLFPAIIEFFKDIISGRKFVKTYEVIVTVTFPRNSDVKSNQRDEVTLYTLVIE